MQKTPSLEICNARIHSALKTHADRVRDKGPNGWIATLTNGVSRQINVHCTPDLLRFETTRGSARRTPRGIAKNYALACFSNALPGLAKFTLQPGTSTVRLQAEIPLVQSSAEQLDRRINEVLTDIRSCWSAEKKHVNDAKDDAHTDDPSELPLVTLSENGWKVTNHKGLHPTVSLAGGTSKYRATLVNCLDSLSMYVPVVRVQSSPQQAVIRAGLARLVLECSGVVNVIRATLASGADNSVEVRFECRLRDPDAGEVDYVLHALQSACLIFSKEVNLLADDAQVAKEYLQLREVDTN